MNRNDQSPDNAWETDAVWKLLDQAPAHKAGPRFVDDVVRMARLEGPPKPWWHKFFAPAPLVGLTSAAAAITLGLFLLKPVPPTGTLVVQAPHADTSESFADVQVAADQEVLLAASDRLDEISDGDLVSLLGF
jgi:hypothetical protein